MFCLVSFILVAYVYSYIFFSSRRRHTRCSRDWSSDVCSSDLVRQAYREDSIRPGGTISGPTMMALADFAMYVAVLGAIGPVPLAVTINLNINFLRKPSARDLTAEARLLKLGKRLATGEVAIRCAGE